MISEITRFAAVGGTSVPVPVIFTVSVPTCTPCALNALIVIAFGPGAIVTVVCHVCVPVQVIANGCVDPASRISFTSTHAVPLIVIVGPGEEPSGVVILNGIGGMAEFSWLRAKLRRSFT